MNFIFILVVCLIATVSSAQEIDVFIKGMDDGVKTNKQQDYTESVMNAKLQAIERAGVEIKSITEVVNFQLKYDMIESKSKAILLPGFQIMDMGYQTDGTYQIVLSGKVRIIKDNQESSKDNNDKLKNDINGTWKLNLQDQSQPQFVHIKHNMQYGTNPKVKKGNLNVECNNKSNFYGMYYNGKLRNMQVEIKKASYYLTGSISSDGKKIVGSYDKKYYIDWTLKEATGTFEMERQ